MTLRLSVKTSTRLLGQSAPAVLTILVLSAARALGQDIVSPAPQADLVPVALQQARAAENVVTSAAVPPANPQMPLAQWGPTILRASLSYRLLYGDGLPAITGQHFTTAIHDFSPNVTLDLGAHWSGNYAPTWVVYSNRAFKDTFDQSARLAGWGAINDWVLNFSSNYSVSSSPSVEIAAQTKQTSLSSTFSANYTLNSALALQLTAQEMYQSAENYVSSHDWATTDWINYLFAPRSQVGLGLGLGYVEVSHGANMGYYQPQAQVTWALSDKITVATHGGAEIRQIAGSSGNHYTNPIYGAEFRYQPIETTQLSIGANRVVGTSYFENQITRTTGWNASVQQRLLKNFYLRSTFSRGRTAYLDAASGTGATRSDNTRGFDVRLSTVLFQRCPVAVFFQSLHNSTNAAGFGLSSRQIGVEIGFNF